MRVLALDLGDRRVGVAVSDPTRTIATPLMTLRRASAKKDQQIIRDLIEVHSVERLVIGLPKTLRGELGPQAQKVLRFGQQLADTLVVPVLYWDERHSTVDAEQIIRARGRRRARHPGGDVDAVAAAVILQGYLDSLDRE